MKKKEDILLFLNSQGINLEELQELHIQKKIWDSYPNILVVPKGILSKIGGGAYHGYSNSILLNRDSITEKCGDDEVFFLVWIPTVIEIINHESMHWVLLKIFNGNMTVSSLFDNVYYKIVREYCKLEEWEELQYLLGDVELYESNGELKFMEKS